MKNTYKTKARESIVSYLKNNPDKRFTAREIFDYVKDEAEGVNRTTVYRNLDRLCEQGDLTKFKEPNQDAWFFQYSVEHKHCNSHMHAQCSECGKIFHLEKPFVDDFESKLRDTYGLDVNASKTVIIGVCEDCHKNDSEKKPCHLHYPN